eukprot:132685-Lingulodinium_polyedra.AAC.1
MRVAAAPTPQGCPPLESAWAHRAEAICSRAHALHSPSSSETLPNGGSLEARHVDGRAHRHAPTEPHHWQKQYPKPIWKAIPPRSSTEQAEETLIGPKPSHAPAVA